jgi:hypothetical protein
MSAGAVMDYDELIRRLRHAPYLTVGADLKRAAADAIAALQEQLEGSRNELQAELDGNAELRKLGAWECETFPAFVTRIANERDDAFEELKQAYAKRDAWHQAYLASIDPIIRAKLLEPAPPMVAPIGAAEEVLLRERDELRGLLREARKHMNDFRLELIAAIDCALSRK